MVKLVLVISLVKCSDDIIEKLGGKTVVVIIKAPLSKMCNLGVHWHDMYNDPLYENEYFFKCL